MLDVTTAEPVPFDPQSPGCRLVNAMLQRLGDKWTMAVVATLASGPRRFSELRRAIEPISQRMLTLTLRNLERDGLVSRTVTPSIPPRVDYALTALGLSLQEPVLALARWADTHLDEITASQTAFDRLSDSRGASAA